MPRQAETRRFQSELDLSLEPEPDRADPLPMRLTMGPLW